MSYFNLKFRVNFLGHEKNVKVIILFFTVYVNLLCYNFIKLQIINAFILNHNIK